MGGPSPTRDQYEWMVYCAKQGRRRGRGLRGRQEEGEGLGKKAGRGGVCSGFSVTDRLQKGEEQQDQEEEEHK